MQNIQCHSAFYLRSHDIQYGSVEAPGSGYESTKYCSETSVFLTMESYFIHRSTLIPIYGTDHVSVVPNRNFHNILCLPIYDIIYCVNG